MIESFVQLKDSAAKGTPAIKYYRREFGSEIRLQPFMRNSVAPATRGCAAVPPLSVDPLDNSIDNHAHPEVHEQSEIKAPGTMASRRRQMGHQSEEVKQVAHDNGNELLEESAEHETVVHQKQQLAVGIWQLAVGRNRSWCARPLGERVGSEKVWAVFSEAEASQYLWQLVRWPKGQLYPRTAKC